MNRPLKLLASSLALVTSGLLLHAASDSAPAAPALPVISIAKVEARDSATYATQMAAVNAVMKSKFGVDQMFRIYLGEAAGEDSGAAFAIIRAESFTVLMKNIQTYRTDPALAELRASLDAIRELHERTFLKAVRFDGVHPNAWTYTTYVNVTDEPGYISALGQLRSLFDGHGLNDAKLNAYRVIAGRTNYTHLVSVNTPSTERLGAVLDAISSEAWATEWITASAKFRTVVRNGTYREITR